MRDREVQKVADYVVIIAGGFLDLVGLIGNSLLLIVLCKQVSRSTYIILQAICITDLTTLYLHLIFQTLALYGKYSVYLRPWTLRVAAIIYYVWPALMVCHNVVVWLTVLLSLERWLAVCKPLEVKLKLSHARTRCLIVLVCLCAVLYNLPRVFEYEKQCLTAGARRNANANANANANVNANASLRSGANQNQTNSTGRNASVRISGTCFPHWTKSPVGEHVLYSYLYGVVAYTFIIFLVPVTAILSFNAHLFCKIRRRNTQVNELSISQRVERKISKMPLCIAVVFCVFETPVTVANIVENGELVQGQAWTILVASSSVLMLIRAASNILLYFVCASQFRTTLRDILWCRRPSHSTRVSVMSQYSLALTPLITNSNTCGQLPKRSNSSFSNFNSHTH